MTSPEEIQRLRFIGFRPLTYPYLLPLEEEEFERARAQLAKDFVPHVLVYHTQDEVEIWTVHDENLESIEA